MVGATLLARPLVVYVVGVVTGPLIKPVVRGSVKGAVKAGLHVKRLAGEAAAEVQGIAAEMNGETKAAPPVPATTAARK